LKAFKNRVLRRIFGFRERGSNRKVKNYTVINFVNLNSSPNIKM